MRVYNLSRTRTVGGRRIKIMDEKVTCPQCHKAVARHCAKCGWLVCMVCEVMYGKSNFFYFGKTKH